MAAVITSDHSITVVIPTRNGENVIRRTLAHLEQVSFPDNSQIVVVENGSQDSTPSLLESIASTWTSSSALTITSSTSGLGHAYTAGIRNSTGSIIYLTADDLPFGIRDLELGLPLVSESSIVIGSKSHKDSVIDRPWPRQLMTSIFAKIRKLFLNSHVGDSQGTFLLWGDWSREHLNTLNEGGFLWTTELVDVAESQNLNVIEIPVTYQPHEYPGGSRIKARDVIDMAFGVVRIRVGRRKRAK